MKIHPKFSDCPSECTKNGNLLVPSYDASRFAFCDVCPQKRAKDKFRELSENLIKERFKEGKTWRFDDLVSLVYEARNMEEVPKNELSVKSNVFLSVYLQEKNRKERLDDIAREKKRANQ